MIIKANDREQIYHLMIRLNKQQQLIKNMQIELLEESDINKNDVFLLLESDEWANAVSPSLIFASPEELKLRASLILDKFFPDLKDKTFLDYGCGNDLVVQEARKRGVEAYGYDFVPAPSWSYCDTKLNNVKYDCILVHDVFDHAIKTSHVEMMSQITSVSHLKTVLKIRIHPWTSRHGSHAYKYINKAFIHLIFTPEELLNLGCCVQSIPTIPLVNPVEHYEGLFAVTGWKIKKSIGVFDEVEPFFTEQEEIKKRLTIPKSILRISFIDYELVRI